MTLLGIEGFENRTSKDGWSMASNATFVAGKFGGTALSSASMGYSPPSPVDVMILGMANFMPLSATTKALVEFYDSASGSVQCRVSLRSDRYIEISRSAFTVVATSAGPVGVAGEWIYVEMKCRLNDVTGFVEVRVNNVVVASFTGDNLNVTVSGQNTGVTRAEFYATSLSPIDDLYVCDSLGAAPYNNYIGECQIENLVPNGNGAFSQLSGSDGNSTDNYLLVDEQPAVDADNVSSSTVGQRDTYTFTDPGALVGEVLAVQTNVAVSKLVAGEANVKIIERLSDGTERLSGNKFVSNLATRTDGPKITDPSGSIWTPASVTEAQFGVEVS